MLRNTAAATPVPTSTITMNLRHFMRIRDGVRMCRLTVQRRYGRRRSSGTLVSLRFPLVCRQQNGTVWPRRRSRSLMGAGTLRLCRVSGILHSGRRLCPAKRVPQAVHLNSIRRIPTCGPKYPHVSFPQCGTPLKSRGCRSRSCWRSSHRRKVDASPLSRRA